MTTNHLVSPNSVNTLSSFGAAMLGGITGYLAELPTGVLICAIFGASFYIAINHNNLTWKKQIFFFLMSFYLGTTDAAIIMALIMSKSLSKMGIEYEVDIAIGALVVSAGGITILLIIVSAMQNYTRNKVNQHNNSREE